MIQTTAPTFIQSPRETLDYAFDFSEWLAENESIASFTVVTSPVGLTITSSNGLLFVTVILSGGVVNTSYNVLCKITTDAATPRVKEAEFNITIREI